MAFRIHTEPRPIAKPKRRKKADKAVDRTEGQRQPRLEDSRYLDCIRQLPCLVSLAERGIEAAHVRMGSAVHDKPATGMQEKPSDSWCVPLSQREHRKQHSMSERRYWQEAGIDVCAVCNALWAARYDVEAMREIVFGWTETALPEGMTFDRRTGVYSYTEPMPHHEDKGNG